MSKYHSGIQEIVLLWICLLIPVSQVNVTRSSWEGLEGGEAQQKDCQGSPRIRLDLCWAIPGVRTPC